MKREVRFRWKMTTDRTPLAKDIAGQVAIAAKTGVLPETACNGELQILKIEVASLFDRDMNPVIGARDALLDLGIVSMIYIDEAEVLWFISEQAENFFAAMGEKERRILNLEAGVRKAMKALLSTKEMVWVKHGEIARIRKELEELGVPELPL